jgi:predicted TIM-barrel fold metal-dependent hydrolase
MIDAHAHLPADHSSVIQVLDELGVKVLNISLGLDAGGAWRAHPMSGASVYAELARTQPRRFAWCTAFDPPAPSDFDRPRRYVERVMAGLERDFGAGAVACKVWKNIGMELRDGIGNWLMVDDRLFEPVFALIEREQRSLIMHTGEPRACWEPLDERSPHYDYYSAHPTWHMFGREDVLSHAELIAARDRVVARHPRLRVVGAHLGSLEYDVGELAQRFERFPNFSVDSAERLLDLTLQPVERVREFFERYSDRLLWGSDLLFETAFSTMDPATLADSARRVRCTLEQELAYFGGKELVEVRGRRVPGLGLSGAAQERFFDENARRVYQLGS